MNSLCGIFVAIMLLASYSTAFITSTRSVARINNINQNGLTNRLILNMLKIGDVAPDFQLTNAAGKVFKLSSFKGKKPVVVFFYPADSTPGCTKEACAFERKAPDFKKQGAEVFGISSGDSASKSKFISTNSLKSIELLIDDKDDVRKSWEVPKALFGLFPGRVTYVIGKDGKVKSIYDDLANAELHPEKALETLMAEKSEPEKKSPFSFKL